MHTQLRTVISGSYGKHFGQMLELKEFLEMRDIIVQAPVSETSIPGTTEFILLDADPVSDPRLLQDSIFAKIRMSTFLTLANVDRYLGNAAVLEVGYAIAVGLPVYSLEPVTDPNIAPYARLLEEVFPDWARRATPSGRGVPTTSQVV